jgi:hypothetical protein
LDDKDGKDGQDGNKPDDEGEIFGGLGKNVICRLFDKANKKGRAKLNDPAFIFLE